MTKPKPDLFFVAIPTLCATIFGYFGSFYWLCALVSQFRPQLALGSFVLLLLSLKIQPKDRLVTGALILSFVINFAHVLYGQFAYLAQKPRAQQIENAHKVKLYSANVLTINNNYQTVLDQINKNNPDIVVLIEVSQKWMDALTPLYNTYPYRAAHPKNNNFGIAFLSKYPFTGGVQASRFALPFISATVQPPDKPAFTVMSVHIIPGVQPGITPYRQKQYDEIIAHAQKATNPLIMTGDFNDTVYSAAFARFLKQTGLNYGPQPFKLMHTWPVNLKRWYFATAIDHILVRTAYVTQLEKQPDIGSDHYALAATIALQPRKAPQ